MNANVEAEVIIIGAGATGAAAAWRLASQGIDVLCLEQGDWVTEKQIPKSHADWAVQGMHNWNWNQSMRQSPADYPISNLGGNPIMPLIFSGVGGSTVAWGAAFWRFQPSDFKTNTVDGFGCDWPFAYEDLVPYYEINEEQMGMSGLTGDPTQAGEQHPPLPPISPGPLGERWMDAFEKLGWYWWVQHVGISSRDYKGRPACSNRGFCAWGCPTGSLATAANTYMPAAQELGTRLVTNARVREITTDADGAATGVLFYNESGELCQALAKVVVAAGNGIGTPRLLLMSRSAQHPDGLGNSSGLVGKNLMVHVQTTLTAKFPNRIHADHAASIASATSRHFYETDPANDFKRGFVMTGMPGLSPLDTALQTAPWGEGHHAAFEENCNKEALVWVCGDDEPEESNRIELDWDNLDAWGMPGVKTFYTLSENSKKIGAAAIERAKELADAAGAESYRGGSFDVLPGWHLLGTVKMGEDPSTSVVDADCRSHDVRNLFVVDGSVMPAGGTVNPTHTVQAVALRAADKIVEQLRATSQAI